MARNILEIKQILWKVIYIYMYDMAKLLFRLTSGKSNDIQNTIWA